MNTFTLVGWHWILIPTENGFTAFEELKRRANAIGKVKNRSFLQRGWKRLWDAAEGAAESNSKLEAKEQKLVDDVGEQKLAAKTEEASKNSSWK